MKRIVLISDTHGVCDERICRYLDGVDEIWHAGDIGSLGVVDVLRRYAPVRAVYGNIDDHIVRCEFPEFLSFEVEGVSVLMTHIGGYPGHYQAKARAEILAHRPKLFVCGHSHILRVIYDKQYSMLAVNPGAAGLYGFHPVRTLIRFTIDSGEIKDMEVVEIPRRSDI